MMIQTAVISSLMATILMAQLTPAISVIGAEMSYLSCAMTGARVCLVDE